MLVRDVMTEKPVTVHPDTKIKDAATILAARAITAMPVVDDAGRLCGVLSEADVIRDAFVSDPRGHLMPLPEQHSLPVQVVSEVMTPRAISVHPSTDAAEAAELMTSTAVKSLPVLDDCGRLVGVVSRSDLVSVRARGDGVIEREVNSLLVSLGHHDWTVEVNDGAVRIDGPEDPTDRSLAEIAATSVAGVVLVKVM